MPVHEPSRALLSAVDDILDDIDDFQVRLFWAYWQQ